MKKLEAILKGCKFVDKLFGLREKEIRRKLEAAKDECEEVKIRYQLDYEKSLEKLGAEDVDYGTLINAMVVAKQGIADAEATLKVIKEIEKDLDSDVAFEEEKKK